MQISPQNQQLNYVNQNNQNVLIENNLIDNNLMNSNDLNRQTTNQLNGNTNKSHQNGTSNGYINQMNSINQIYNTSFPVNNSLMIGDYAANGLSQNNIIFKQ